VAVAAVDRWSVDRLLMCRSGVELVDRGFGDDVLMAAAEGADDVVPVLVDRAFVVA
jgi:phosphosulfolactate phosphohydrolase-like enzyme